MSEATPEIVTGESDQFMLAQTACLERLSQQAENIPEIAARQEVLAPAAAEIIDEFSLEASLFEDEGRSLIFMALADRWATNKNNESEEEALREKTFIADALALLAYKHSPKLALLETTIKAEQTTISKSEELKVYDKYTDKALSEAMQQGIAEGLLDEVKSKLGVTPENEDTFEVRVLTIDKNGDSSHGIVAPPHSDWNTLSGDRHEKLSVIEEEYALTSAVRAEQQKLIDQAEQMGAELGKSDVFGIAWVTELGEEGRTTLCIAAPLAKKLLYPETTKYAKYYRDDDRNRDIATLEHEYSHTQGGLSIDKDVWFGIGIEERRAEEFSGNKMGYQDIKGLFQDIRIATGFDALAMLRSREKGGTQPQVYADMANILGLQGMLEVLMAAPTSYISEQSNQYQRGAWKYLGGYDGIIGRLLEREKQAGNIQGIEPRVEAQAQRVIQAFSKEKEPGEVWGLYRKKYGLNIVTDMVRQKVSELSEAA